MEVAKIYNKKNIGMYTDNFKNYENILFERKHKQSSWKSDKFRSLSQPLINIIKRDTKITRTTELKKYMETPYFRKIMGIRKVVKKHTDILGLIGLKSISHYYEYEILKFRKVKNYDVGKTKDYLITNYDTLMPIVKIKDHGIEREFSEKSTIFFNKIDMNTNKELMKLYPYHKTIIAGIKNALLFSDSITK